MQRNAPIAPKSITALGVVHGLKLCAEDKDTSHLVDPHVASINQHIFKLLIKHYPFNRGKISYQGLTIFPASFQKAFMDTFGVIGLPEHVAMRKLLVEQQTRQAVNEGATQVVILGAGYDVLASRLHQEEGFKHVNFYELDRGATRKMKLFIIDSLLERGLIEQSSNLMFLDCDLSQANWQQILFNAGFKKDEKTFVIIEGLTMYLTIEQNNLMLQVLKNELLSAESKIIISFNATNRNILENKGAAAIIDEAQESLQTALSPNEVLKYAHTMQFSVIGKALANHFQEAAHPSPSIEENKHKKNLIAEHYYLLNASTPAINADYLIEQVTKIDIALPFKADEKLKQRYKS